MGIWYQLSSHFIKHFTYFLSAEGGGSGMGLELLLTSVFDEKTLSEIGDDFLTFLSLLLMLWLLLWSSGDRKDKHSTLMKSATCEVNASKLIYHKKQWETTPAPHPPLLSNPFTSSVNQTTNKQSLQPTPLGTSPICTSLKMKWKPSQDSESTLNKRSTHMFLSLWMMEINPEANYSRP